MCSIFYVSCCLVFTSLYLHIVIDSEMRDISDKPFRFVRPAYHPTISPLASIFHPSIHPSPHAVLPTNRLRNQFGVVKHKKRRSALLQLRPVLFPRGVWGSSWPSSISGPRLWRIAWQIIWYGSCSCFIGVVRFVVGLADRNAGKRLIGC